MKCNVREYLELYQIIIERTVMKSLTIYEVRFNCYKLDQQNAHTLMFQFTKLLLVSILTGPSSGSAAVQNYLQAILSSAMYRTAARSTMCDVP